ncbi:hypothetical protein ACDA63_07335 [Uliginosibacterium sp. sgz301328]|uniref:hypothetical protein n=1 Tax=Uliginosibacterium sp. sgz301328 TaxID=3243764 RepID=UPI00359D1611
MKLRDQRLSRMRAKRLDRSRRAELVLSFQLAESERFMKELDEKCREWNVIISRLDALDDEVRGMTYPSVSARLSLDTTVLQQQVDQLRQLLLEKPGSGEQALDFVDSLLSDVVFGECVATTGADGVVEIRRSVRIGESFERLVAAVRARDIDGQWSPLSGR